MSKIEYFNKSHVTQLSDALIIQLNIFKYIDGISKKFIPNLSIDEEISLWGNRMALSSVIYHEGEQSHCRHYTSRVNMDDTWFLISDTRILRQQKLQCSLKDISVPYALIYRKRINFLVAQPNSLNSTAQVSSTSELISEIAETIISQFVLQELEKTESKISYGPTERENQFKQSKISSEEEVFVALEIMIRRGRSSCVITLVKMKKKKQLKKNMTEKERKKCVITSRNKKKNIKKKEDNKRKKAKHDNLDDNQKEKLKQYKKWVKKVMCVNFNDEKKEYN